MKLRLLGLSLFVFGTIFAPEIPNLRLKLFEPLSLQQLTMRPIIKNIIANAVTLDEAINGIHKAGADSIQIRNLLDDDQITDDIMEQLYEKFGTTIDPDDAHYAYIDVAARLNVPGARDWYKQNYQKGLIPASLSHDQDEDKFLKQLQRDFLLAIQKNNVTLFTFLVNLGASIELFDDLDISPLGAAIANDNVEMVDKLLELGADPNAYTSSRSSIIPLVIAILEENPVIIQMLLEAGADQGIAKTEVANAVKNIRDPAKGNQIIQLLKQYNGKTKLE